MKQMEKASKPATAHPARKLAVIYARVSSKEQEKEGFSIPAQLKLLKEYATAQSFTVVQEYVDVETAKQAGRTAFGEMVALLWKAERYDQAICLEHYWNRLLKSSGYSLFCGYQVDVFSADFHRDEMNARHHHLPRFQVTELEQLSEDEARFAAQKASFLALLNDQLQFLGAVVSLFFRHLTADADGADGQRAQRVECDDERKNCFLDCFNRR